MICGQTQSLVQLDSAAEIISAAVLFTTIFHAVEFHHDVDDMKGEKK